MTGLVSAVKDLYGFGFIVCADISKDVFFHHSALVRCRLNSDLVGKRVEFELGKDTGRGPRAERVEVLD